MTYLFAAYTIVWIGIFAYSYSLGQQAKRLAAQVETLEAALKSQGEAASSKSKAAGRTGRA